jgi:hypothetical protein
MKLTNKFKNGSIALLVLVLSTLLQGCVADMVMKSQDREHYSDYVKETGRLNLEREKAGLAPQKIMTFDEWRGGK